MDTMLVILEGILQVINKFLKQLKDSGIVNFEEDLCLIREAENAFVPERCLHNMANFIQQIQSFSDQLKQLGIRTYGKLETSQDEGSPETDIEDENSNESEVNLCNLSGTECQQKELLDSCDRYTTNAEHLGNYILLRETGEPFHPEAINNDSLPLCTNYMPQNIHSDIHQENVNVGLMAMEAVNVGVLTQNPVHVLTDSNVVQFRGSSAAASILAHSTYQSSEQDTGMQVDGDACCAQGGEQKENLPDQLMCGKYEPELPSQISTTRSLSNSDELQSESEGTLSRSGGTEVVTCLQSENVSLVHKQIDSYCVQKPSSQMMSFSDLLELDMSYKCTKCGAKVHDLAEQEQLPVSEALCLDCCRTEEAFVRSETPLGHELHKGKTSGGAAKPCIPSAKHVCRKCGRQFTKWKHLSIHFRKVHHDDDDVSDPVDIPEVSHESLPFFCCKTCNIASKTIAQFHKHRCRLPNDDDVDYVSNLSNRILITNIVKLHQLRKYICEVCSVEYRTFKRMLYHLTKCQPGPYSCTLCAKVFPTLKDLNYHKNKTHRGEKCFVCEECGKSFMRRTSLRKHSINWHEAGTAVGPFRCDVCPKKFIRRIYLTYHKLRMHGLDKKFLCQICGNKFLSQNSLMNHMQIHDDIKKFECGFCQKQFKRKDKMKQHERIHTGERPFQCQTCSRTFVSKTRLTEHAVRHQGNKRYRCSYCPKTYAGCYDLKKHIKAVHNKQCDKVLVSVIPNAAGCEIQNESNIKKNHVLYEDSCDNQPGDTSLQQTAEELGSSIITGSHFVSLSGSAHLTIPMIPAIQGGPTVPHLGHTVQVSGSSVPLAGVTTLTGTERPLQAAQGLTSVHSSEFSISTVTPQSLTSNQGFIYASGYEINY